MGYWTGFCGLSYGLVASIHINQLSIALVRDYIVPTTMSGLNAAGYLWDRQSRLRLYQAVKEWVAAAWPFSSVAYPGRGISHSEWAQIEEMPN